MSMQEALKVCMDELISMYSHYEDSENIIENSPALSQAMKYIREDDPKPDEDRQICIVEKVDNGFILKIKNLSNKFSTFVFECDVDEQKSQLESLVNVFENIKDYFGIFNSKHDSYALDISVVDREDFPVKDTLQELKDQIKQLESCDNVEPDTLEEDANCEADKSSFKNFLKSMSDYIKKKELQEGENDEFS